MEGTCSHPREASPSGLASDRLGLGLGPLFTPSGGLSFRPGIASSGASRSGGGHRKVTPRRRAHTADGHLGSRAERNAREITRDHTRSHLLALCLSDRSADAGKGTMHTCHIRKDAHLPYQQGCTPAIAGRMHTCHSRKGTMHTCHRRKDAHLP